MSKLQTSVGWLLTLIKNLGSCSKKKFRAVPISVSFSETMELGIQF
jgi:hypothetical protein